MTDEAKELQDKIDKVEDLYADTIDEFIVQLDKNDWDFPYKLYGIKFKCFDRVLKKLKADLKHEWARHEASELSKDFTWHIVLNVKNSNC